MRFIIGIFFAACGIAVSFYSLEPSVEMWHRQRARWEISANSAGTIAVSNNKKYVFPHEVDPWGEHYEVVDGRVCSLGYNKSMDSAMLYERKFLVGFVCYILSVVMLYKLFSCWVYPCLIVTCFCISVIYHQEIRGDGLWPFPVLFFTGLASCLLSMGLSRRFAAGLLYLSLPLVLYVMLFLRAFK